MIKRNGLGLVQCQGCGLMYVSPRPPVSAIADFFKGDEFHRVQVQAVHDAQRMARDGERLAIIQRHHPTPGRLLDVGCSTGRFLGVARDAGWDVIGVDVNAGNVEYVRGQGIEAHVGDGERLGFPAGSFDVVTFFDSLAHMHAPMEALKGAVRLLKPDGMIMVTTPNVEGLVPRVTYNLLGRTVGVWEHPIPTQVYSFSRRTLAAALEKVGMGVVHSNTEPMPASFTAGVIEEAFIDRLKGRREEESADAEAALPTDPASNEAGSEVAGTTARARPSAGKLARRAIRGAVYALTYGLAASVSVPARLLDRGDSMVVLARRLLVLLVATIVA